LEREKMEKFLRRPEVESATGLPRSTIYERIAAGTFPKPVKIGDKSVAWREAEIIEWQKGRVTARDEASRPKRHRPAA
jgi:prophage regulatory protein